MNSEIRAILTDIKAAVRIGHPESLWAALEGLLNLPQTLGNPPMTAAFIEKSILPIGEALASPRLNLSLIQPLSDEPYAVLRASAAAALAFRYLNQDQVTIKQLSKPSSDTRQDVRLALQLALSKSDNLEALEPLIDQWLAAPSPRQQALAIALLANQPQQALNRLARQKIFSDPDVRASMVETLISLAGDGHAAGVLNLLETWTANHENHAWTICKTLAGSWAAAHVQRAMEILRSLHAQTDNPKQIINTLQALHRHGGREQVISSLQAWKRNEDHNLQTLADQVLSKLET